jgi:hypothetical protein
MRYKRLWLSLSALVLTGMVALQACSSTDKPPYLDPNGDGGLDLDANIVQRGPCDPPQSGCPCVEAGIGSQVYCGVIYRTSGNHVDCSKGYRTCLDDGGWGACEGPRIYGADQ